MVLSGGGTRGIYQIGALKALEEHGLLDDVTSISGTSIGSINATIINQYSLDECKEIWLDIAQREVFKGIDQFSSDYFLKLAQQSFLTDGVDINPFINIFEELIIEEEVRSKNKELVFSLFNISKRAQEYACLDEIPQGLLMDYLIASSRLPFFKPLFINKNKYLDGGVGDNNPYFSKLKDKHFDLVINVKIMYIPFYIPGVRIENITYDNEIIISPSGRIGNPIEFISPSFEEKYKMGYKDGNAAAEKYLKSK